MFIIKCNQFKLVKIINLNIEGLAHIGNRVYSSASYSHIVQGGSPIISTN